MVPIQQESYILKLPSEILEYIIDLSSVVNSHDVEHQFHGWQYPEHSYVDLKSIALCCRHLYMLVAPFLWRDKEFILPREDTEKSSNAIVQMATDILSKRALFHQEHYLGDYVRSLSRDLTNGPHYDLQNSKLMAHLVVNLKALRMDFHPKARTEHYGLRYFAEYCPNLTELYLSNCRDTFNDFLSLCEYKPPLISLTLSDCTIKETTLQKLSVSLKPTLSKLLLSGVLIEPSTAVKSNTHLIDTTQFIHPFHYRNSKATAIPQELFHTLTKQNLTHLALSDSVSYPLVKDIVTYSPHLEKLAIAIHELNPHNVNKCLQVISKLSQLSILSLAFRKYYPLAKECEKLPCHAPASSWSLFAKKLTLLKVLYISTTRLVVYSDFIPTLSKTRPQLSNIIIHNLALVTQGEIKQLVQDDEEEVIRDMYLKDCQHITFDIQDWNSKNNLYTFEQAKEKGFNCFDESDQVCYIKGFL